MYRMLYLHVYLWYLWMTEVGVGSIGTKFETAVSCYIGAGRGTQVLLITEPFPQVPFV